MSDGQRSGRSTDRVSCKSTELKRCSMIEMRWNIIIIIYPGTQFLGNEKITLCNTKSINIIIISKLIEPIWS